LPFDLSIKNYDDLCESSRHVPLILVVVCVPPDLGDWLEETPEHTAMRRCAYGFSARVSRRRPTRPAVGPIRGPMFGYRPWLLLP
jgi:hypothetical protein